MEIITIELDAGNKATVVARPDDGQIIFNITGNDLSCNDLTLTQAQQLLVALDEAVTELEEREAPNFCQCAECRRLRGE